MSEYPAFSPLRVKDALRSQIITMSTQINDEARLRRIAQFASKEWLAEQGGELILKEASANGR